jgi:hypothetical protein
VAAPLAHQVQVIQHQHHWLTTFEAGVHQRRQHHLLQRRVADLQAVGDRGIQAHDWIERGDQARHERDRVVVGGLQRNPGKGPLVALAPQRQQRRLAIAGRRRDQNDRAWVADSRPSSSRGRSTMPGRSGGAASLLATMRRRSAAGPEGDA